jgi:hypothetical protein
MSVESLRLTIECNKGQSLSNSASALFFSGFFGLGAILLGAANRFVSGDQAWSTLSS